MKNNNETKNESDNPQSRPMNISVEYFWKDTNNDFQSFKRYMVLSSTKVEDINKNLISGNSIHDAFPMEPLECEGDVNILVPVFGTVNPFVNTGYLVMCEVYDQNVNSTEHNHRANLIKSINDDMKEKMPKIFFTQNFTLTSKSDKNMKGFLDIFSNSCMVSGITINKTQILNSQVFGDGSSDYNCQLQIGGAGMDPITASDHLNISRFLLESACSMNGVFLEYGEDTSLVTNYIDLELVGEELTDDALLEKISRLESVSYTMQLDGSRSSVRKSWQLNRVGAGSLVDTRPGSSSDPYEVAFKVLNGVFQSQ